MLAGAGIGGLQYAGQRLDASAVGAAVAGVTALVAGLRPLVPPGTARAQRGLPTVVAARGLLAGSFFGVDSLLPRALSQVQGYGPTAAGLPLTTGAVGWAVASQWQGRHPAVARVRLLRAGLVLVALGVAGTALIAVPRVGGWPAAFTWAVAGLGMGLGMPSLGVLLLAQSPESRRGADSAALQIADVTGAALCTGLTGVLVAASVVDLIPLRGAVVAAVTVHAGIAVLGAAVAHRAAAPVGRPVGVGGAAKLEQL